MTLRAPIVDPGKPGGGTVPRVLIVPGLAVRSYARDSAEVLRARGVNVELLPAPSWRGMEADVRRYGERLARDINADGRPVALMVGLSLGTQSAAVAAVSTSLVERLLLVSPTVDSRRRTLPKLVGAWLFGKQKGDPSFREQVPDWGKAGIPRIVRGLRSSLNVVLEEELPKFCGDVTVVEPEYDTLGSPEYASLVARAGRGRLVFRKGAAHSWPIHDEAGFADLVEKLLATPLVKEEPS